MCITSIVIHPTISKVCLSDIYYLSRNFQQPHNKQKTVLSPMTKSGVHCQYGNFSKKCITGAVLFTQPLMIPFSKGYAAMPLQPAENYLEKETTALSS